MGLGRRAILAAHVVTDRALTHDRLKRTRCSNNYNWTLQPWLGETCSERGTETIVTFAFWHIRSNWVRTIGNIFYISGFFLPGCCVWTNSWPIEVAHKPILYQMFRSSDGRRVIIGKPVLHFPSLLLLLFLPTTSWISHNLGTFVFSTRTLKTEIKSIPACHYLLPKQSPCGDHWIEYFPASNCRKFKIEFWRVTT